MRRGRSVLNTSVSTTKLHSDFTTDSMRTMARIKVYGFAFQEAERKSISRRFPRITSPVSLSRPTHVTRSRNLVPRVFSLFNMAAAREKTLAHSRITWPKFPTRMEMYSKWRLRRGEWEDLGTRLRRGQDKQNGGKGSRLVQHAWRKKEIQRYKVIHVRPHVRALGTRQSVRGLVLAVHSVSFFQFLS